MQQRPRGSRTDLALVVAPEDDVTKACEPDDACVVELVDGAADLDAELTSLRTQLVDRLRSDRADREQDARDREPATVDEQKLLAKLVDVTASDDWKRPRDEVAHEIYAAGGLALPRRDVYTKGQIRCALASGTVSAFWSCFDQYLPIDAGVDDAAVPGD